MKRHGLNAAQLQRWQRRYHEGKRDVSHAPKGVTRYQHRGNGAAVSRRQEAYIMLTRWYEARLKWIRSGGVPGTHDVYAELALRALEGGK
jgi:hypothetical protein